VDPEPGEVNETIWGTGIGVEFQWKRNVLMRLDWGVALSEVGDPDSASVLVVCRDNLNGRLFVAGVLLGLGTKCRDPVHLLRLCNDVGSEDGEAAVGALDLLRYGGAAFARRDAVQPR
jgi:hypothetical protein